MTIDLGLDFRTLDALPIFAMVADADGTVVYFNRLWHEFTGQPPFERDDGNWSRYIHPADVARVAEDWKRAVDNNDDVVEIHHRLYQAATGTYRWIQTRAVPFRDTLGNITHWLGVAMDVEEHHRAIALSYDLASKLQEYYAPTGLPVTQVAYFSAWYEPAQQKGTIGGDWYKAVRLDDERILFAVGDVLGHGLQAAIMMGRARQAVLVVAANHDSPAIVLQGANKGLVLQEIVATCAVGILNTRSRKVSIALAGHVCPIFVGPDGTAMPIGQPDLPLGVERDASFVEYTLDAVPGSALVLYTDGLLEFDHDVLAGERRLMETAARIGEFAGPNLAQEFATRVLGGATHDDDIAVLTIAF